MILGRWRAPVAATALILASLAGCTPRVPGPERSVILVTLDTTRADRIGAYGSTRVPTPHLDRIAREGARFDAAISQVPLTLPAHSSMMTSQYPATHGVRHNGIYRLPDNAQTLAERLAAGGWDTAGFVASYVLNRGFGVEQGFRTYGDVAVDRFAEGRDQVFEAERHADAVNEDVFRWLDARESKAGKFFLWVHYYDPHDPYDPPETPGRTLHGEGYDREISYLDHAFGDLMARLERDGVLDRAILVVVGDHGESLGEHEERTHGIFLYEGAMRVPLFVRAPGIVPAESVIAGPVELVDLAPTILELTGQPALAGAQGRSLTARLRGADGEGAVAHGETLQPLLEFGWSDLYMVRTSRFKYIQAPVPELYDLESDPHEIVNLAPNDPQRAAELAAMLAEWTSLTGSAEPAPAEAERTLSAEELARLQSLGYMSAGIAPVAGDGERPDPKSMIGELRRLDQARDWIAAGEYDRGLVELEAILRQHPMNFTARSTRFQALVERGRYRDAEDEARAGVSLAAAAGGRMVAWEARSRSQVATALRLQGRNAEAEAMYRELLRDDAQDPDAGVDLARLLTDTGRPEEALGIVDKLLALDPRNGYALAERFRAENALGREDAAFASARALAEARAGDPRSLVAAGDLLMRRRQPALAATVFEVALGQAKELDAVLLGKLGRARLASGDAEGATEVFGALARLTPRDPRPYHYLGVAALQRGDERAARRAFADAVDRDPAFSASDVALGRWLAEHGRAADAQAAVRQALTRNPGDPDARRLAAELGVPETAP